MSGLATYQALEKRQQIRDMMRTPKGYAMKRKARILLLLIGLFLPYMFFMLYFALRLPQQRLPNWFPYVAACYFFGSIFVFPFLRKKVLAGAPSPTAEEQNVQNASAARAARRMGYIWWVGPVFYLLSGGPFQEPWWVTALGFSWIGFLSWASFRVAQKIETKARQDAVNVARTNQRLG
jgi:hypothetical protein